MKSCEIRLYNARGLCYTGSPQPPHKTGEFTDEEKFLGHDLELPKIQPLDAANDQGYVKVALKDLSAEEVPYRVRVYLLAEYEPEKL